MRRVLGVLAAALLLGGCGRAPEASTTPTVRVDVFDKNPPMAQVTMEFPQGAATAPEIPAVEGLTFKLLEVKSRVAMTKGKAVTTQAFIYSVEGKAGKYRVPTFAVRARDGASAEVTSFAIDLP